MEYEIELKLLTFNNVKDVLEQRWLPDLQLEVKWDKSVLTNHYFDTADQQFRNHKMGLRIRGNNQQFEQTLKTQGETLGGLHQRPEYNVSIAELQSEIPTLSLFPNSAWPSNFDVLGAQKNLRLLFTTHFTRYAYLFELPNGTEIELVWDVGEIRCADKVIPINEIELELKKGDVFSLFDVAKQVTQLMPTSIGIDSKAARGYELLHTPTDLQSEQPKFSNAASGPSDNQQLETRLNLLQQSVVDYCQNYSMKQARQITPILQGLLNMISQTRTQNNAPDLLTIEEQLSNIIEQWSEYVQKDNAAKLIWLVTHAAMTQVQLDLMQYLLRQVD